MSLGEAKVKLQQQQDEIWMWGNVVPGPRWLEWLDAIEQVWKCIVENR